MTSGHPTIAYSSAGGFLDIITNELDMLARLSPNASAEQARAELTNFFARPDAPEWHRDVRGVVHSFRDIVLGDTKPAVSGADPEWKGSLGLHVITV